MENKKELQLFIDSIAKVNESNIADDKNNVYYSKVDGSYLTRVGMEDNLAFLLNKGITEEIQNTRNVKEHSSNIGFNPTEKKWYGWSHRAIFGFGIGSECKKGHCGYQPADKEDYRTSMLNFWGDDIYSVEKPIAEFGKGLANNGLSGEMVDGIIVSYTYNDEVPNKALVGTKYTHFVPFPEEFGKGEWTASTLLDAKQMAIDFAESVS